MTVTIKGNHLTIPVLWNCISNKIYMHPHSREKCTQFSKDCKLIKFFFWSYILYVNFTSNFRNQASHNCKLNAPIYG
nr:hypothetical protein Iba_scaffold38106CG0010 [Ipomoea batatas]